MPKYVGRRIVPKHGGIWDKTKEYEELIIVLCQEQERGTCFRTPRVTSVRHPVPTTVPPRHGGRPHRP